MRIGPLYLLLSDNCLYYGHVGCKIFDTPDKCSLEYKWTEGINTAYVIRPLDLFLVRVRVDEAIGVCCEH